MSAGTGAFDHFVRAQAHATAGFAQALAEVRGGAKTGHWIWYVFPQLAGLGRSSTARRFGLAGLADACAYLGAAELRDRLFEITRAVAEQLRRGKSLPVLMGSTIDAQKLVSSLTLFEAAARRLARTGAAADLSAFAADCAAILAVAEDQGYPRCAFTSDRIRG